MRPHNKKAAPGANRAAQKSTSDVRHSSNKSTPRVRGKAQATLALEQAIVEIVAKRHPITVRGVCYALFVCGLIPCMATKETNRVSRVMTAMRETGELDWTLVVDGSRAVDRVNTWRDPSQIINAAVRSYRRDYWQDQPKLVEVWSEKSTVQGVLAPVLDEFGVTFRVMKGFGSFTAVRQAAEESNDIPSERDAVVLYVGDHDPSGLYMSKVDLPRRLERYGARWQFKRVAVTVDDLPHLPYFATDSKSKDPRYRWYIANSPVDPAKSWEVDALDPNSLRARVQEQIETCLDLPAWEHAKNIEAVETASMRDFHAAWQSRLIPAVGRG